MSVVQRLSVQVLITSVRQGFVFHSLGHRLVYRRFRDGKMEWLVMDF
jgi:hypothetical protein